MSARESYCPAARSPRASKECITSSRIPKAADGYASTGDFADGSIIVYELREAQQKNGFIFEGDRRRVDVMIKDSSLYKNSGGWRFERFWANDQTKSAVEDAGASCFACHANAKTHGFVFSQLR